MIPNFAYLRPKPLNYRDMGKNRKKKSFSPEFKEFFKMIPNFAYLRPIPLNY
jgi:hypothetical protein